jgi:transposase
MHATSIHSNLSTSVLYVAFELSLEHWKLAFAVGTQSRVRVRTVRAGDLDAVQEEIRRAQRQFGLPPEAKVVSGYEAGRDGFWLHRALTAAGLENRVLESSSLQVDRRSKRVKTDRLDAEALVRALVRREQGDRQACRYVHVPSREDEDARHLQRELQALREEKTQHTNRMIGLLFAQGVRLEVRADFPQRLAQVRTGDGAPLGVRLVERLLREFQRLQLCVEQIRLLEAERNALFRRAQEENAQAERAEQVAARLGELRGIGPESAWTFSTELFSWRQFRNRREVGAMLGLTPCPYQSGASCTDQGVSKAGPGRLRSLAVEVAWLWLRYQPHSALAKWFQERFAAGGKRMRRVGIVALARKLMIALWKYLEWGEIPEGAVFKTEAQLHRQRRTPSLQVA